MKTCTRSMNQARFDPVSLATAVLSVLFVVATPISAFAVDIAPTPALRLQPGDDELTAQNDRITVGYLETVIIKPGNLRIDAKIDTGARTSSIHTTNILPYVRDGQQRVRFTVVIDGDVRRGFDLPVLRVASIRRASMPPQRRFVVEMEICLAGTSRKAEVNLVDRRHMSYRMLIGREFMAGQFIVDPTNTFLTRPDCRTP